MSDSNNTSSGLGFFSALAIVFITLKLCGVINWSWWLVTLPAWGGIVLSLVALLIYVLIMFLRKSRK